jgi:cell division protein FtsB
VIWKKLHPQHWTWKHYAGTAAILAAVNLLGPMGVLHGLLITQETERLEAVEQSLEEEIEGVRDEVRRFQSSQVARERAIREGLGFLKPDEVSFEFLEGREARAKK